jgi:Tfp pilus assembly protein PilF
LIASRWVEAGGPVRRSLVEVAALAVVVAGAVALAMGSAVGHPFLLGNDELETVVRNPVVQGPLADALGAAFRTWTVGAWAPLHLISHALDRAVFGSWAGGSALVNLLLHTVAAVLVAWLARRLGAPRAAVWAAALVFALHPVQVEAVVSITQRKTVLSSVFIVACLHAWVSYARAAPGRRAVPYALALVAALAALLTKPVAVILPVALALLDLPLGRARVGRRWLVEKLPFLAAAGALVAMTVLGKGGEVGSVISVGGHDRTIGLFGFGWYGGGPLSTFLTMLTVLPRYLALLAWPAELSIVYLPPVHTRLDAEVLGAAALVAAIGVGGVALVRRSPRLACWLGLFFLGLAPVAQIFPQATLMNDRYLYVPLLGGAPLAGEGLALLAARLPRARRAGVALAMLAVAVALGVATRARVPLWASDLALWTDAARKAPGSFHVWYNLGHFREDAGDESGAVEAYRRAASLDPLDPFSASHASALLMRRGAFAEALPLAERTARSLPQVFDAQYNAGFLRFVTRDPATARATLERAAALDPSRCDARTLLAHALALSGEVDRAAPLYEALRGTPCDGPDVALYRAFVAGERGDEAQAARELEETLRVATRVGAGFLKEPTLAPLLANARFDARARRYLAARAPAPAASR